MGLRDAYGRFDDVDPTELNRRLRQRRERERAQALTQAPLLDLSGTEWQQMPDGEIANAAIFAARGRLNGYPARDAEGLRNALAARHAVAPERIVVGNGAAELLQAAALALLGSGDELLTLWPSYPLYPLMAKRAGAEPVAVADLDGARDAIGERTRLLVLCNPNDPTGELRQPGEIAELASRLPDRAWLLVDEALIDFATPDRQRESIRLTDALERLIVVRTFSKAYGLSGLRIGYAVGSPAGGPLLDAIAPVLGVNALSQAAAARALSHGDAELSRRRELVATERSRLISHTDRLGLEAQPSAANFVWLRSRRMRADELAAALRRDGVLVARGSELGDDDHVRISVRDGRCTDRLLAALERYSD